MTIQMTTIRILRIALPVLLCVMLPSTTVAQDRPSDDYMRKVMPIEFDVIKSRDVQQDTGLSEREVDDQLRGDDLFDGFRGEDGGRPFQSLLDPLHGIPLELPRATRRSGIYRR